MKKSILILFLAISSIANAQFLSVGNALQRQIIGVDTTFRFNLGSPGFAYMPTTQQVKNLINTGINTTNRFILASPSTPQSANINITGRITTTSNLNFIGGFIFDSNEFRGATGETGWNGFRFSPDENLIQIGRFPFTDAINFIGDEIYDTHNVKFLKEGDVPTPDLTPYLKKSGGTMTGDLILSSATPPNALSAAPIAYVNNAVNGLSWKGAVSGSTTANITLSGSQTLDGVATGTGKRWLVKNQTTASQNGIYITGSGAWNRATDADTADELTNLTVLVNAGTTLKNTVWNSITPVTTVGTDAVNFAQTAGPGSLMAGTNIDITANVVSTTANPTFGTSVTSPSFIGANFGTTSNTDVSFQRNSLHSGFIGDSNIGFGYLTLPITTTGVNCAAFGRYSLASNTTGNSNVGLGSGTLILNTTGSDNLGIGSFTLSKTTTSINNVGIGTASYLNLTSGNSNIGIGFYSAWQQTSGSNNISIGSSADLPNLTGSNQLNIGGSIYGTNINGLSAKIGINTMAPEEALDVTGKARVSVAPTNTTDVVRLMDLTTYSESLTTTNTTATPLSKSMLNSAYPTAPLRYEVVCPTIGFVYKKYTSGGDWYSSAITILP